MEEHYREIIEAIGEDPEREGLLKTPHRAAEAFKFLTSGYHMDVDTLLNKAVFTEPYEDLILVKNIEFFSLCVPSKQLVNAVDGAKAARDVRVRDQLWTLHEGRVVPTTVTDVASRHARELVEVETDKGTVRVTPDHPFATPDGWMEARDLEGRHVEWTPPRSLCRRRTAPKLGYPFGYAVGAVASDGTVGARSLSLVVNERSFAQRFSDSLAGGFGISTRLEPVERPSGYTGRQTPGYRVRLVSSYVADLFRQYLGGDAHHMRQGFPRVVLGSLETFQGFLDGYVDGDGCRSKYSAGRTVVSGNKPFLQDLAGLIGARFTPNPSHASTLYIADSWLRKHGFRQEDHRTDLDESRWVRVKSVRPLFASGRKPYTVYSFTCDPYPTYLVNGHLTHNCEHHLLPFFGEAHVAYLPGGKIIGLSKIARLVNMYARRLQVQERLTQQIGQALEQAIEARGVAVVIEAKHMCMMIRGVQKLNSVMVTSHVSGEFRENFKTRAELFNLLGVSRTGMDG